MYILATCDAVALTGVVFGMALGIAFLHETLLRAKHCGWRPI